MTAWLRVALLAVAAAIAAAPAAASPDGVAIAQLSFHSRVVIRIEGVPPPPPITHWIEKKGPRCLAMGDIQGSAVIVANSVDLALRGGDRVRMRFERSCPGLNYYAGFYVVPSADGKICSGRDAVRDRAGVECAIDKLRRLVPAK